MTKLKVFISSDWFVPGFRAGGPITSLYRMCELLGDELDFYILSNNHDWHQNEPYDLPSDMWVKKEAYQVWYTSQMSVALISKLIASIAPDVVYFNGIYSPRFHALPLINFLVKGIQGRIIVAPRGMLNPNAIALKSSKKKVLLSAYKLLGLQDEVVIHAASEHERLAVTKIFPKANIRVVSNVPAVLRDQSRQTPSQRHGFVSVARVSAVKNTRELLSCFERVDADLHLIGGYDDLAYHRSCQQIIDRHAHIQWTDGMSPDQLDVQLPSFRFFVSMTSGENFGHAIVEALAAGCPVIISDQTPWNDLEQFGAGWVLPLHDQDAWIDRINQCKNMDDETYRIHSDRARSYVSSKFDQAALREQYLKLFTGED